MTDRGTKGQYLSLSFSVPSVSKGLHQLHRCPQAIKAISKVSSTPLSNSGSRTGGCPWLLDFYGVQGACPRQVLWDCQTRDTKPRIRTWTLLWARASLQGRKTWTLGFFDGERGTRGLDLTRKTDAHRDLQAQGSIHTMGPSCLSPCTIWALS